ncbi:MAG: beta-galactosidase [Spirochaetota bacterium]
MKNVFILIGIAAWLGAADERVLFDFSVGLDLSKLTTVETKISHIRSDKGAGLGIEFNEKYDYAWPGVKITVPAELKDISRYTALVVEVRNIGVNRANLGCQLESTGGEKANRRWVQKMYINPGEKRAWIISPARVEALPPGFVVPELFHMNGIPSWARKGKEKDLLDMADLQTIIFYVTRPTERYSIVIERIGLVGENTVRSVPVDPLPFVDTFGQYLHDEWPGKTHSIEEMKARADEEAKDIAARPKPNDRSMFNGWKTGPRQEARGFFYTAKHDGKWWFVDPEGYLFFMHGMHGMRFGTLTPVAERDTWFKDAPFNAPSFKDCFGRSRVGLSDYEGYRGREVAVFNFHVANLKRKYGAENWRERFIDISLARLASWGMNALSANGDGAFYYKRKLPYYFYIDGNKNGTMLEASKGYWSKFYDVFAPDFEEDLRKIVVSRASNAFNDPWCIGLGIDNELSWGDERDENVLAAATLQCPATQPAKIVFANDLRAKYGDIGKLNEVWGSSYGSWDAILAATNAPDTNRAHADLSAFYAKTADNYFRMCRNAVKACSPKHLYMGCRFAWTQPRAVYACAKYADVITYNIYRTDIRTASIPADIDKPFMVTEFHITAPDRGYFSPSGLVEVADQRQRASGYQGYVKSVLENPRFVGCNWFIYQSQPLTGANFASENYQSGFVDICDTPYAELVDACREIGYSMYGYRAGGQ